MVVFLAEKITGYLISKDIIGEEEHDVYRYGYEILTSSILGIFLILGVAALLSCIDIAVIFLCVFCGLRSFCGGYHASSYFKCNATFVLLFILESFVVKYLNNFSYNKILLFIMSAISFVLILMFAPLENKNKPLTEEKKKINKRKTIGMYIFWMVIGCILYSSFSKYSTTIVVSIIFVAILLVVGKIKQFFNKEEYYEK